MEEAIVEVIEEGPGVTRRIEKKSQGITRSADTVMEKVEFVLDEREQGGHLQQKLDIYKSCVEALR